MSQFRVEKVEGATGARLIFFGSIDEDAAFSEVSLPQTNLLALDLEKVESINSCGIREWIKWIKEAPGDMKMEFHKCPKVIVDQINMVSGFLPASAQVKSFFVPYYSEDTGEEKLVLFEEGREFSGKDVRAPEEISDEKSGVTYELDVIEAKYFKFLTGK